MLSLISLAACLVFVILLEPLGTYIWDSKKLRRFYNQNILSGVSNLGYIIERCRGFRSRNLNEVHKKHSIVRIGPNSLSFSTTSAIRSIYGHSTPCTKGDMYTVQAGSHSNITDAVNKSEHARKRRLLSHTFATRNLEQWEFKVADKVQRLVHQFDRICEDAAAAAASRCAIVDWRKWVNLFTVDAIADIVLSHSLGCID
ncbi:hypothetical protein F4819DRAFT_262168 [Hypoxylon fuscum]|nr:hypothetical protein F4819DRAFT_262168 [Hypoxylon fuscum]